MIVGDMMAPDAPLQDLLIGLRKGSVTSRLITETAISNQAANQQLPGPYCSFSPDLARSRADQADRAFAQGKDLGPLQGIPTSVKDIFGVNGFPLFAGSPKQLPPRWETQGPVVNRIQEQLGVIAGKTHTVEFALGGLGTNRHYGTPENPWDPHSKRICGGSSSGAGLSLLDGSARVAIATDTTGSVRMPASMTGTVGLMVSQGRWSAQGIVPVAPKLDAPGLLTLTVADLIPAFLALDPSSTISVDNFFREHQEYPVRQYRIGVPRNFFWDDCSEGIAEGIEAALSELEKAGITLVPFELPQAHAAYELFKKGHISTPAVYSLIKNEFSEWWDTIDPNVRERLSASGEALLAHDYLQRLRLIDAWALEVDDSLRDFDAIAMPTVAVTPACIADIGTAETYQTHNLAASRNASTIALLGLTALSMPIALDALGMPVGLQLASRHGCDLDLIGLGLTCERVLGTRAERLGSPPSMPT